MMSGVPSISEFYAGRSLFITGATGFMGKVLVEKLLRACPDIKCIYLLIRPKKGKEVQERLDEIVDCKLFDKLRKQEPDFKCRLGIVEGDMIKEGLGLDQAQVSLLAREVSVVFHAAATIKFDEEMKLSVQMNILGVKSILELSQKLPRLEALVHISTAYANCNQDVIREEIYDPPLTPTQLLSAIDWMDSETLNRLTPKMVGDRPNTYTYTKAIAESLLAEAGQNLPIAIFRPSIVGATMQDPMPGWVDNINGPTGLFTAIGKGVLRIMKGDKNATADIIPVDLATNMLITCGWYTGVNKPKEIKVYNCTTGSINRLTWGQVERYIHEFMVKNPLENIARIPNPRFTKNVFWHDILVVVDHMLPAYLMDFYMWISGRRRMFVRIQDRLQKAVGSLDFFTSRSWTFTSENLHMLEDAMTTADRKVFPFNPNCLNWPSYLEKYCLGTKQYILKEDMTQLPAARKAYKRLQKLTFLFNAIVFVVIWRLLVKRVTVARVLWNMILGWAVKFMQRLPGFAKST